LFEDGRHCVHHVRLTSREGIVFVSEKVTNKMQAEAILEKIGDTVVEPQHFSMEGQMLVLSIDGEKLLRSVDTFETPAKADEAIERLVAEFANPCSDPEGMHLIEHILLTPRTTTFHVMDLSGEEGDCVCDQDTYTVRASVVLPYWRDHFDHPSCRT